MDVSFEIPKEDDDLVYPDDRYVDGNSPNVIYFPSNLILFKMMRACLGVSNEMDIWFNSYKYNDWIL